MTQPDPRDQPGAADQRWPGWAVDSAVAAAWAAILGAALSGAVGVAALVAAALLWRQRGRRPVTREDVRGWLERRGVADDIRQAIGPAIQGAAVDGWEVGVRSTAAVLDAIESAADPDLLRNPAVSVTVDWSSFVPGRPDAAALVLSGDVDAPVGLLELLERSGVTIESVAAHRLDEVAAVLHDGLEQGRTIDEIALALRGVLDDPRWAHMTAWTETSRAMNAATLAGYAESGIAASEWLTAFDQRVCLRCGRNEDAGPVPLGEPFPTGDEHPPAHPRCRCALIPVIDGQSELDELTDAGLAALGIVVKAAGGRDNLEQWWKHGEGRARWVGTKHPWTALYRGLRRHMSSTRAKRTAGRWYHDVYGHGPTAKGKG